MHEFSYFFIYIFIFFIYIFYIFFIYFRDHRKIYVGDSRGRVYCWSLSDAVGMLKKLLYYRFSF